MNSTQCSHSDANPQANLIPRSGQTGFSRDEIELLKAARQRSRRIAGAMSFSRFSAWSLSVFAVGSALLSFGKGSNLIAAAALGACAVIEFRGGSMLRKLRHQGLDWLFWNQVVVAALVLLYVGWNIHATASGNSPLTEMLASADPQSAAIVGPIDRLARSISMTVYSTVGVIGVVYQACAAGYYASRRKYLTEYLRCTPTWVHELQRSGVLA